MIKSVIQRSAGILLLFIVSIPLKVYSQDITGIWRGYFISDFGEQYKYELQIEQSKANHISGVSYSYLDTRFYGKALLTGSFIRTNKSALIQEVKTVEVKMTSGSETCIMKCLFTYATSGKEEFLEGTYSSTFEKKGAANNPQQGIGC
ncbi:MAG TPA: hypothetical protein VGO09_00200, partial [Flavisolibacter sp.]|nr:hypothetical protein [Flavisolibacter sp.]